MTRFAHVGWTMTTIIIIFTTAAAAAAILFVAARQEREIARLRTRLEALPPPPRPAAEPITPSPRFGLAYESQPGLAERVVRSLGSPALVGAVALVGLAGLLAVIDAIGRVEASGSSPETAAMRSRLDNLANRVEVLSDSLRVIANVKPVTALPITVSESPRRAQRLAPTAARRSPMRAEELPRAAGAPSLPPAPTFETIAP